MRKQCNICDHRCVCINYPRMAELNDGYVCENWSGWHNVCTDPPEAGMTIVAIDNRIVFAGEVIEDHGLTIKAGCVSMKLHCFEKWRDLPEYEVEK